MNTAEQKVADLLKPRWKVLGRYPDSPFQIGIIGYGKTFNTAGNAKFHFEDYPLIFRKLEWWEEREEKDMPQYVKWNYIPNVDDKVMEGCVEKVTRYVQNGYGVVIGNDTVIATKYYLPATETEYQQYLLTQK